MRLVAPRAAISSPSGRPYSVRGQLDLCRWCGCAFVNGGPKHAGSATYPVSLYSGYVLQRHADTRILTPTQDTHSLCSLTHRQLTHQQDSSVSSVSASSADCLRTEINPMVVPRGQTDNSPPMTAPTPISLSTAAVEELNVCSMTGPSGNALDRWLCEILLEHPPSATDLLLLAPAAACGEISIASSSVDPQSPVPQTEPPICTARLQLGIQPEEPTPADGGNPRLRLIVHRHGSCERTLKQLHQHEVPQFLRDIVGRFRVWTANSGARRRDRMSLDHRLRESIKLKEMVIKLLEDLNTALQQGELNVPCM